MAFLDNKTCIITGGAGSFGGATAQLIIEEARMSCFRISTWRS
jgi:FlaA1/EpsC-like NDP-sugar epimerase